MGDDNELKLVRTGLEQDLNAVVKVSGVLSVPEIVPAARQMAADGIVLLKNENKLLPLRAEQTVAVFGRCAVNYFVVGYGSGGDVIPPYRSSLMDGPAEEWREGGGKAGRSATRSGAPCPAICVKAPGGSGR